MKRIKIFIGDAIFVFLNYFVAYIPLWFIRKLFYRLFGMKIGRKSRINMRCIVWQPWRIKVGRNTIINEKCLLDGRGGLEIGDYVSISYDTIIYTASHISNSPSFEGYKKRVSICNGVWIGARSIILPGAVIDTKAIVAAGSIVNKNIGPNQIWGGSPAVYIKEREIDGDVMFKDITYFR